MCLPSSAHQIVALLRRPGIVHDLHAAEPYAVVSLVMAVLQPTCTLAAAANYEQHSSALLPPV